MFLCTIHTHTTQTISTILVFGVLTLFASISTAFDLMKNDDPKHIKLFRKQRSEHELLLTTAINVSPGVCLCAPFFATRAQARSTPLAALGFGTILPPVVARSRPHPKHHRPACRRRGLLVANLLLTLLRRRGRTRLWLRRAPRTAAVRKIATTSNGRRQPITYSVASVSGDRGNC